MFAGLRRLQPPLGNLSLISDPDPTDGWPLEAGRLKAPAARLERRHPVSFRTRRVAPSQRFNAGKIAR